MVIVAHHIIPRQSPHQHVYTSCTNFYYTHVYTHCTVVYHAQLPLEGVREIYIQSMTLTLIQYTCMYMYVQ